MVAGYLTYLDSGNYVTYKVINSWDIDTNFLATGSGKFSPLFPNEDISINSGKAVYPNFNDSIRGYYDEYAQVIRYMRKPQDCHFEYFQYNQLQNLLL